MSEAEESFCAKLCRCFSPANDKNKGAVELPNDTERSETISNA